MLGQIAMAEFYARRKFKKLLYSKFTVVFLLVPIAFMANAAFNAWEKKENTEANLAAVTAELDDLQAREESIKSELERLDTPHGLEEEIRGKFELGREGEQMVVMVDDTPPVPAPIEKLPAPWWQFWADE